jgi:signal transduction histidine kinase
MRENLEKIKGFFKDEPSFFAAKQLLFEMDQNLSLEALQKSLDLVQDAVYILDRDWNYVYANERALLLTGMSSRELLGKNVWITFPFVTETELGLAMMKSGEDKQPREIKQFYGFDNRWFDFFILPFESFLIVRTGECTQMKEVELDYGNVLFKNKAIITAIPDELYRIHKNGLVINYKDYPEFSNWNERNEIQFLALEEIFPKDRLECITTKRDEVITSGIVATMEFSIDKYDGEKFFEMRLSKSGEEEVLAIVRNISIRKKAEILKNEFISLVSHELRTPLTSIKGAIELLIGGVAGELNAQTKSLLNICKKNTQRLVRFVGDLLDLEALNSGNINFTYKNHCLGEIVETVTESMRSFADQFHVSLKVEGTSKPIIVFVDEDRLIHCINNLISNAVKYTPKNETVSIRVYETEKEAYIEVSDCGPGIDADFQPRLFHRFAQGAPPKDKLVGGSGLGLSVTKAFLESMLGSIGYKTSDSGTTFQIKLPKSLNEVNQ